MTEFFVTFCFSALCRFQNKISAHSVQMATLTIYHCSSAYTEPSIRCCRVYDFAWKVDFLNPLCNLTTYTLPQDACQQFANSVSSLPPADAERVGRDAGGVRVLEALIQGPASAKQKTRLLRALAGRWASLASEFSSSHLVEKCYAQSVSCST